MTKKKEIEKLEPKTTVDSVVELLEKYIDTAGAIMDDYVADRGMVLELAQADKNLKQAILNLPSGDTEIEFEKLLEKINEHDDYDSDKIFSSMDADEVESWAADNEYVLIKLDNMLLRDKLQDFISKEIYPFHADQRDNVNI